MITSLEAATVSSPDSPPLEVRVADEGVTLLVGVPLWP